jgi:hypothetical protein
MHSAYLDNLCAKTVVKTDAGARFDYAFQLRVAKIILCMGEEGEKEGVLMFLEVGSENKQ